MVLNEFLKDQLNVELEGKYNAPAVREILQNKEEYPILFPYIVDMVEEAAYNGREDDYDCPTLSFDGAEPVEFDMIMELYRAFLRVFVRDFKEHPAPCKFAYLGMNYLRHPHVVPVVEANILYYYLARYGIGIEEDRTCLISTVDYPFIPEAEYLGPSSTEEYSRDYYANTDKLLEDIGEAFRAACQNDTVFQYRFDDDDLMGNKAILKTGAVGYTMDTYTLTFGKNTVRLFSTNRDCDPLSAIRSLILHSLTDEQRTSEVATTIESGGKRRKNHI